MEINLCFAPSEGWGRLGDTITQALGMLLFSLQVLLEGVHSSCEESRVRECLRKVQESS